MFSFYLRSNASTLIFCLSSSSLFFRDPRLFNRLINPVRLDVFPFPEGWPQMLEKSAFAGAGEGAGRVAPDMQPWGDVSLGAPRRTEQAPARPVTRPRHSPLSCAQTGLSGAGLGAGRMFSSGRARPSCFLPACLHRGKSPSGQPGRPDTQRCPVTAS